MRRAERITQEQLKKDFVYDPVTGNLYWRKRFRRAGSITRDSYLKVHYRKGMYQVHRLIWFYIYGEWPSEIDHINRNGLDNRLENLRVVTHSDNQRNRKPYHKYLRLEGVSKCTG